jgi:hypothetical protein
MAERPVFRWPLWQPLRHALHSAGGRYHYCTRCGKRLDPPAAAPPRPRYGTVCPVCRSLVDPDESGAPPS